MSRAPRHRRPSPVRRWEGIVDNIADGMLWCQLLPAGRDAPEVWAAFEVDRMPDAQAGDVFNLYVWQRGRKVRTVLRRRDLGVWTEAEVVAIREGAARMAETMRGMVDET
jgi:hypothetical protein